MNNITLNYKVNNNDFVNMGAVSDEVREKLKTMHYSPETVRRVSNVLYQGEINMLIHAGGGEIKIEITDEAITMTLTDHGFGEGMGFTSMKKYSDDMQIYSEPGVGTTVILTVNLK